MSAKGHVFIEEYVASAKPYMIRLTDDLIEDHDVNQIDETIGTFPMHVDQFTSEKFTEVHLHFLLYNHSNITLFPIFCYFHNLPCLF